MIHQSRITLALHRAREEAAEAKRACRDLRAELSNAMSAVARLSRDVSLAELPARPTAPPAPEAALDTLTCHVCYTNLVDVALQCGHCICSSCVAQIRDVDDSARCPHCRRMCKSGQRIIL
jgi:hypothetical protein